jgi:hypothetical protein
MSRDICEICRETQHPQVHQEPPFGEVFRLMSHLLIRFAVGGFPDVTRGFYVQEVLCTGRSLYLGRWGICKCAGARTGLSYGVRRVIG